MKYKLKLNFISIAFVIILGAAISREVDFETWTVEKPLLVALYGIALVFFLITMIKKRKEDASE
jgi:uncharacterized membrane protein